MAKIKHEVWKCIGCYSCESVCPEYFKMKEENSEIKAELIGCEKEETSEGTLEKREIKEKIDKAKEAESICPVDCIHVEE
jgi:ferredoxin